MQHKLTARNSGDDFDDVAVVERVIAHPVQEHLVVDCEVIDWIGEFDRETGHTLIERIQERRNVDDGTFEGELGSGARVQH